MHNSTSRSFALQVNESSGSQMVCQNVAHVVIAFLTLPIDCCRLSVSTAPAHLLTHSLTQSLIHSFAYAFTSLTSVRLICSLTHLLSHLYIRLLTHSLHSLYFSPSTSQVVGGVGVGVGGWGDLRQGTIQQRSSS